MTNIAGKRDEKQKRKEQKTKVFSEFLKGAFTMFTVSKMTGVLRSTICGYVAEWKKQGIIYEVKKDFCPYTKHKAVFYTTNKKLYEKLTAKENINSLL